jgi:hypothetical protein
LSWSEGCSGVGSVVTLGSWASVLPGPPLVHHAEATMYIRRMWIWAMLGEVEKRVGVEAEEEGDASEEAEDIKINTFQQVRKWNRHKKQNSR